MIKNLKYATGISIKSKNDKIKNRKYNCFFLGFKENNKM